MSSNSISKIARCRRGRLRIVTARFSTLEALALAGPADDRPSVIGRSYDVRLARRVPGARRRGGRAALRAGARHFGAWRRRGRPARYVELHAHSAYSFLDGASLPEELAARAAELGYDALALTDHDGVYGSLEFAHAAKHFGVRPITGAEVTLDGGTHVTLLCETQGGYANLCRILTDAHAGTRPRGERREPAAGRRRRSTSSPSMPKGSSASPAARATGSASLDANAAARLARRFPARSTSSCSGRTSAATRSGTRGSSSSPSTSACRPSRPATSTRTTSAARGSRTRSSRSATARRSTAASASGAATTSRCCSRRRTMLERLPREAALRTREVADRCALRPDQELGYRYPDFSDGPDPADVQLEEICDRAFGERYAGRERPQAKRARAARRRAGADRAARPLRVLPAPLGGARARARVRARGARAGQPAPRAAAGARARLERRLDRLLPHRPLARRPGRGGPLARPLHQRRDGRRARHRPRLPARHPREADRPRHRALRPRARRARRELRDLPQPRRDPRRRQGARAAVRRAGAARARHRRLGRGAGRATSSTACRARMPARAGTRSAS